MKTTVGEVKDLLAGMSHIKAIRQKLDRLPDGHECEVDAAIDEDGVLVIFVEVEK